MKWTGLGPRASGDSRVWGVPRLGALEEDLGSSLRGQGGGGCWESLQGVGVG